MMVALPCQSAHRFPTWFLVGAIFLLASEHFQLTGECWFQLWRQSYLSHRSKSGSEQPPHLSALRGNRKRLRDHFAPSTKKFQTQTKSFDTEQTQNSHRSRSKLLMTKVRTIEWFVLLPVGSPYQRLCTDYYHILSKPHYYHILSPALLVTGQSLYNFV